jgi:ferric-dicitrate binding protein FerR (iron transport regulator)
VEGYADRTLDDEASKELLMAFAADADLKTRFLDEVRLQNSLHGLPLLDEADRRVKDVLQCILPNKSSHDVSAAVLSALRASNSGKPWYLAAKAMAASFAVVAVIAIVVFAWSRRGVEVEVVQTLGAVSEEWVIGQKKRLRHFSLVRGSVQLRLSSGVLLDVSAPMEMTLVNDMHVQVLSGRITADVGDDRKGFVMETPQARVVDLGTRFGVDASDASLTSVLVFQGQVEVYEKGATQPVALLNTGEGLRLDNHRRASRIVSVSGTDAVNGWTATTPPAASALIAAVRDTMAANDEAAKKWPSLRNFYRIVPGGMREGALAFADAPDEWSDVPASLMGADQVRTFAVDGFNWFMKLTIEVTRPVELFVLVDQRNPVPEWVNSDFTDAGETITLNLKPSQANGQVAKRLPFSIWKRAVHTAGEVTLGAPYPNPPADKKSFSPNRMFGVAAKALP